jgi:hypothetical protein
VVIAMVTKAPKDIASRDGMRRTTRTSPYWDAWLACAPGYARTVREGIARRDLEAVGAAMEASTCAMHASAWAAVPAVRPGIPAVLGSLSPEVIRRVVMRNAAQVRRCYELSLLRNPTLAGTFSLRFVIDANGRVLNAVPAPGSTLRDAAFELCVTTAVRRWIFPVPPGGGVVTIQYPFVFAPQRP